MPRTQAGWLPAIQHVEHATTEQAAQQMLAMMKSQHGFLGGRVLPPGPGEPSWRAQTFFETDEQAQPSWLPDGLRWVLVPPTMQWTLGFPGAPVPR